MKLRFICLSVFTSVFTALFATTTFANHPVLVEGNSDSPVPGTTLVGPGTSGDFDGDGRIGTAEDTDGADRIFGTLTAALGPGTGAAAGTGANQNGAILIVTSGRFAEQLVISGSNGNVTIEAAPGVLAVIDAVLSGDPAGGNGTRQAGVGISVNADSSSVIRLHNLVIRNFATAILVSGLSRLNIENCRIESCRDFGIHALGSSRVAISDSSVNGTGFRVGSLGDTAVNDPPNPGVGIQFDFPARGAATSLSVTNSFGLGVKGQLIRGAGFLQFNNNVGF